MNNIKTDTFKKLVNEFETALNRQLTQKELKLIQWMTDKMDSTS